ncbi:probable ATP-dependent RNA helicase DDX43 [Thrips palmi]|uniref:RNA helicase n=1 Tax=Thrips palmi TaxID=161013 RepID=A0A6P8Z1E1_THRPL|nr:probable ATP-dependent RNA helicase DDX43 [Thrips palmi]XP_034243435.1 probable ATP-dependent RNA helicase DDX43 [Thrips palmi]XP_034243436.1 probable ATP-dependent RNA helicase DDX43 [Thrips palmi]
MSDDWEEDEWTPQETSSKQPSEGGWQDSFSGRTRGGRGRGSRNDGGNRSNWRDRNEQSGYNENRGAGRDRGGDEGGDTTTINVDSQYLGRIIGKGGSKIRELESESGARIKVNRDDATVVLSGSSDSQQRAKEMIDELMTDNRRGGGGGYGGGRNDRNERFGGRGGYNNSGPDMSAIDALADEPAPVIDWDLVNEQHAAARSKRLAALPPLKKVFYEELPEVANMSEEEVEIYRLQSNNIQVAYVFKDTGRKPIPNPVKTFEQAFHNYPDILTEIYKQGFKSPSPIQCQAWPVLLGGQDLIGISQTGSGKTLAFLLPALIHIDNQEIPRSERGGPNCLVLAPTRELALQIEKEVNKYSYRNIKAVCVYGGGDRRSQVSKVNKGVEIIIATPGRLNDLCAANVIDVTSITYLVLDEADRMLDMGFEPQIRKTLIDIRPDRQTVMTSATWPEGVRRLAQSYMNNPIQVFIGTLDLAACHSVTQIIDIVDEEEKWEKLMCFFEEMQGDDKVIVFVGKKTRADELSAEMALKGVNVQSIHGDREQSDREQALEDIKSGEVRILIATDVASRGIDIGDITHIINYDFPRNIEEYVHRVGRTGRAGKTGTAITFFTRNDWGNAKDLIPILEEAGQHVPDELVAMMERFEARKARDGDRRGGGWGGGRGGRRDDRDGGGFGGGGRGGRGGRRDDGDGWGFGGGGGGRRNKW